MTHFIGPPTSDQYCSELNIRVLAAALEPLRSEHAKPGRELEAQQETLRQLPCGHQELGTGRWSAVLEVILMDSCLVKSCRSPADTLAVKSLAIKHLFSHNLL